MPALRDTLRQIQPYVPGKPAEEVERELGLRDVVKMASNENPLGPSPRAVAAIRRAAEQVHVYPDGAAFRLRRAVAARHGLPEDHFLFGNGSDEIIKLLAEAYVEPGRRVVLPTPSFSTYTYATQLMGGEVVAVPLRDWRMDLEAMADRAAEGSTALVFVCNPNNPSGAAVSDADLRRFLARLPAGVLVVLDEAYAEYVEAEDYPDSTALVREGWPVVALRTFSKIFGLAGLRCGYAIASPAVIRDLGQVRQPFPVNVLAQEAALASLEDPDQVARSRAVNGQGKRQLYAGLARLGLEFVPTEANFILVDLKQPAGPVYEALLRQGVIVRPCQAFGLPHHIRVTIGRTEHNARFLAALERALAETAGVGGPAAGNQRR